MDSDIVLEWTWKDTMTNCPHVVALSHGQDVGILVLILRRMHKPANHLHG